MRVTGDDVEYECFFDPVIAVYMELLFALTSMRRSPIKDGKTVSLLKAVESKCSSTRECLGKLTAADWDAPSASFDELLRKHLKITGTRLRAEIQEAIDVACDLVEKRIKFWRDGLDTAAELLRDELPPKSLLNNEALVGDPTLQDTVLNNPAIKRGVASDVTMLTDTRNEMISFIKENPKFSTSEMTATISKTKEVIWFGRTAIGASAGIDEIKNAMPHLEKSSLALGRIASLRNVAPREQSSQNLSILFSGSWQRI